MQVEVEIVVCSSSGKPIFCYNKRRQNNSSTSGENENEVNSFVSSLQGLLSFVSCTQQEELLAIETEGCRCFFQTRENVTLGAFVRTIQLPSGNSNGVHESGGAVSDHFDELGMQNDCATTSSSLTMTVECVDRLLNHLHAQILFVLSDRGLDVLRKQPGYDLRELLSGTECVMMALSDRWAINPTLRFKNMGITFVRLPPDQRIEITRALKYEPPVSHLSSSSSSPSEETSTMICGVLLAKEKVVAIAQPNKKQFNILVDDLLLLINFVYHAPSLAKSETWTPICLPAFNSSGFLNAYVVFLTEEICLLLLSSLPSPEQFHRFQAKKTYIARRLKEVHAIDAIHRAVRETSDWNPHSDLPLLHHFIYKNELTGECASPDLEFPFDNDDYDTRLLVLNQYAKIHHVMFPRELQSTESQVLGKRLPSLQETMAARMIFERSTNGLLVGMCHEDYRLYVRFDSLANITDAKEQCQLLLERLRRDVQLMSASFFFSGSSSGGLSMWA